MNIAAISSYSIRNNMYNKTAFKGSNRDQFEKSDWWNGDYNTRSYSSKKIEEEPNKNYEIKEVERNDNYANHPESPLGFVYVAIDGCDFDTQTGELCRRK